MKLLLMFKMTSFLRRHTLRDLLRSKSFYRSEIQEEITSSANVRTLSNSEMKLHRQSLSIKDKTTSFSKKVTETTFQLCQLVKTMLTSIVRAGVANFARM